MRERILEVAENLFMTYGLRSVTMDEIAKQSSVSKKTIYQYFRDKDEMVEIVTQKHMNRNASEFDWISDNSINAVNQLKRASVCMRKNLDTMPPSLLFELQKYHSKAFQFYLDFKENVILKHIKEVLERGKDEGLFRSEIDTEILTRLRMEEIMMCFDPRIFPRDQFDFRTVQWQVFEHFVQGILTEKGREEWDKELIEN